jgi:hypothetical protein
MLHLRRVRITQAQFKMGTTIHHQADYKTVVLSTTIPRRPRRPKFLERIEPTKVLPIRRHSDSCSSSAKAVSFRFNLEAMCHKITNVNSLLKFEGYSHVQVSYKLTSCHEHNCRCHDDHVFPNRLDPLDRIQSNLFDGLT